jgi:hypothetical protein
MQALSVRQPYADQIMRGTKRIEHRSRPTKVRGRVYIYASLTPASPKGQDLPRGVIVGTVEIHNCTGSPGDYLWHLRNPRKESGTLSSFNLDSGVFFGCLAGIPRRSLFDAPGALQHVIARGRNSISLPTC